MRIIAAMTILVSLVGLAHTVLADSSWRTIGGWPACVKLQTLQEAMTAVSEQDIQYLNSLPNCIITKPGIKVRVIDKGDYFGDLRLAFRVRAFASSGTVLLWIDAAGIER